MVSEVFPADAFDAVSGNGIAHPFGHGDPKPRAPSQTDKNHSNKTPRVDPLAVPGQAKKVLPVEQPIRFPETTPLSAAMESPVPLSVLRIHGPHHPLHRSRGVARRADCRIEGRWSSGYTASRFRPLARRLLISFLPALVSILRKKPWRLARRILLG
jgi:hypothetical protein